MGVSLSKQQQCSMKYCMCCLASVNQMVLVSHHLSDRMTYLKEILKERTILCGFSYYLKEQSEGESSLVFTDIPEWLSGFHYLHSTRKVCSTQISFFKFCWWLFLILLPPLLQVSDKGRSPGVSFTRLWPFLALKLKQVAGGVTYFGIFLFVMSSWLIKVLWQKVFMLSTGFL